MKKLKEQIAKLMEELNNDTRTKEDKWIAELIKDFGDAEENCERELVMLRVQIRTLSEQQKTNILLQMLIETLIQE